MVRATTAWWEEVELMVTTIQFNKEARKVGKIGHFTQVSYLKNSKSNT